MKVLLTLIVSVLLAATAFAGCAADSAGQPEAASDQAAGEAGDGDNGEAAEPEATPYAFELTDIDGNVHRMSDYAGKPVYLKVWGSWCGPCVSSLPHLNELSAEAEDFTVLSVVPRISGEKDQAELSEWFKELGYENIVVLYDDNAAVVSDFGISAFPTQIFFDAKGVPVYGAMGVLEKSEIVEAMDRIISGEVG